MENTDTIISNDELATELGSQLERGITPEAKTILEDAISRIQNTIKYIPVLFKRGVTLTIEPTEELVVNETNILKSLEKVIKREKDRGNRVSIDSDLWHWLVLQGVTMPKITRSFTSVIYRSSSFTHGVIRAEADKLSVKKDWNIAEAWNIIIAGIMAGEVDVIGIENNGIYAYTLTTTTQNVYMLYRIFAYRTKEGTLCIIIHEVDFFNKLSVGQGVCLGN